MNAGVVLMIQRSMLKGMLNLVDVQTSANDCACSKRFCAGKTFTNAVYAISEYNKADSF